MSSHHDQTVGWPGHNDIQPRIVTLDKVRFFLQLAITYKRAPRFPSDRRMRTPNTLATSL